MTDALTLPRLTASQLAARGSTSMEQPFILVANASTDWRSHRLLRRSMRYWVDILTSRWPEATAEFWLNGPSPSDPHPDLEPLPTATHRLATADPSNRAYLLLQLPPRRWHRLMRFGKRLASAASTAGFWKCLGSPQLEAEWHIKSHWSQLLVGRRGAGMSNHTDSLDAGAWHLQLAGRKRWRLSGRASDGEAVATYTYEGVLHPGEQLYYGAQWAHETSCLDAPTVSVSHSTVPPSKEGARLFYEQVQADCAYQSEANLHLSGELCDAWERCAPAILDEGGEASEEMMPSTWRQRIHRSGATPMAVRRLTRKREDTLAGHYCNDRQGLEVEPVPETASTTSALRDEL